MFKRITTEGEFALESKAAFLGRVFLFAGCVSFCLGLFRFHENQLMGTIDFILALSCIVFLNCLKNCKQRIEVIGSIALATSYVLFTAIYLFAPFNKTRIALFFVLAAAAFFLKGRRVGSAWLLLVLVTFVSVHFIPGFETAYSDLEIVTGSVFMIALGFVIHSYERFIEQATARENDKLRAALRQLEEKEQSKGQFFAAAGHDLRQPLAAANLFVGALNYSNPTPKQQEIIQRLELAMSNFGDLLDALLNISKLDSGIIKPHLVPVRMKALFEWLERSAAPMAHEKGLQFRTYLPAHERLVIRADHDLINAVLMNLVANAIKFTNRGGILVSARQRGNRVLIQVWDTGIGMSQQDIVHIFDEFYQINNPQRDRTKGIGLGLSIAKRALALFDGQISCRSRVGRGSVFGFDLPLLEAIHEVDAGVEPAVKTPADPVEFARGKRFVVVEDDVLVADALSDALTAMGGVVTVFHDAESALAHPTIGEADIYIADYMLGGAANGVEFLDQLRLKLGRPFMGVIVTGDTSTAFVSKAIHFDWLVLHKPITASELIATLSEQ